MQCFVNAQFGIYAVVNQKYEAEILTEYVIRGNVGILKCSIPSFVTDFVQVESWISSDGTTYKVSDSSDFGTFGELDRF